MNGLVKKSEIFLKRNSSTILTCLGATGVVATAIMAVKATPKALAILKEAEEEKGEKLTKMEVVREAGPAYIPSAVVGVSTIACIFGANALNKRQQATLMSAYAMLDQSYKTYREKLKEIHGDEIDSEVRQEIAKDHYDEKGPSVFKDNTLTFFDYNSMQFFESTMEEVLNAEIRFNKQFLESGYAALNEFYDCLGISRVDWGYEVGWSLEAAGAFYGYSTIEFEHDKIVTDDGMEICIISFKNDPTADFLGF